LFSVVNNSDLPDDEKLQRVNAIFKKMTDYTVGIISGAIDQIITPDGTSVTNRTHIDEFLTNVDRKVFKWIQQQVTSLGAQGVLNPIQTQCPECQHEYEVPMAFDNANFFESGS